MSDNAVKMICDTAGMILFFVLCAYVIVQWLKAMSKD